MSTLLGALDLQNMHMDSFQNDRQQEEDYDPATFVMPDSRWKRQQKFEFSRTPAMHYLPPAA